MLNCSWAHILSCLYLLFFCQHWALLLLLLLSSSSSSSSLLFLAYFIFKSKGNIGSTIWLTTASFHWTVLRHRYGLTNKFVVMSTFICTVSYVPNTAVIFGFLEFFPFREFSCHSGIPVGIYLTVGLSLCKSHEQYWQYDILVSPFVSSVDGEGKSWLQQYMCAGLAVSTWQWK